MLSWVLKTFQQLETQHVKHHVLCDSSENIHTHTHTHLLATNLFASVCAECSTEQVHILNLANLTFEYNCVCSNTTKKSSTCRHTEAKKADSEMVVVTPPQVTLKTYHLLQIATQHVPYLWIAQSWAFVQADTAFLSNCHRFRASWQFGPKQLVVDLQFTFVTSFTLESENCTQTQH